MPVWRWHPGWSEPITERLEWRTGVLTARDGTEQRWAIREYPRRSISWSLIGWDRRQREIEAALYAYGADQDWVCPLWWDGSTLSATLSAGSAAIPADTAYRGYTVGGQAVLIDEDARASEVVTISEVLADSIVLDGVTVSAWPAGTCVYPAIEGRLIADVSWSRFTTGALGGRITFEAAGPQEYTPSSPATYRGEPVLEQCTLFDQSLDAGGIWTVDEIDYDSGVRWRYSHTSAQNVRRAHGWSTSNHADAAAVRSWWYWIGGRRTAFWAATDAEDMALAVDLVASSPTIDIQPIGYPTVYNGRPNRQDIEIRLRDGTRIRRRIDSSATVGGVERLTLDNAVGPLAAADIRMISFLQRMRNNSDSIELGWMERGIMKARTSLVSLL